MNLKRVLEVEVMDTEDEAVDYNSMDHSEVNRIFVDDLLAAGFKAGDVLDVGTGTALIPIELAQRLEESADVVEYRIMAIDAAVNMLDLAVYNIEAAGLTERITLANEDSKNLAFENEMFDAVISNSIIHHIPEPRECVVEMLRVLKSDGLIFVRDLMRPDTDQQVKQLVETYAGEENEHQKQMFDDSLRAALSLSEMQDLVEAFGFDRTTVTANSDRHWTWVATKK